MTPVLFDIFWHFLPQNFQRKVFYLLLSITRFKVSVDWDYFFCRDLLYLMCILQFFLELWQRWKYGGKLTGTAFVLTTKSSCPLSANFLVKAMIARWRLNDGAGYRMSILKPSLMWKMKKQQQKMERKSIFGRYSRESSPRNIVLRSIMKNESLLDNNLHATIYLLSF